MEGILDIIYAKIESSLRSNQVKKNFRFDDCFFNICIEFFIACLMAGLEYIHNKNIIHRDIKPENLVLDQDGKQFSKGTIIMII